VKLATIRARVALALASVAQKIASPGVIKRTLSGVDGSERGWWTLFSSTRHLGFQTDHVTVSQEHVLSQATVFACMSLIASDIGKLRAKLMEQLDGIWVEVVSAAFSPVLRKPNKFQTWQKFIEQWILSLLSNGNTYVLKERDKRQVVVAMYVLDPTRCRPLVAEDGSVYYQLQEDDLSHVFEHVPAVPASEIIHDRINCLFHPLVGVSPLFACGLAATKGLRIEENAARFFANQSQPGGVLTAPSEIGDETAKRLKDYFEQNFTGDNAGKVAVLGDGLHYEPMTTNAVDAQLIEQLELSAKQVCACFHVPGYLVGAEPVPPNNNVEALRLDYYLRCLQTLIEGIENSLDDGLGLLGATKEGKTLGVELDLDGLMRMDTATLTAALKEQVTAGITAPNEARRRLNLPPAKGGGSPMMQQQQFSLEALSERDQDKPFSKPPAPTPAAPALPAPAAVEDEEAREEAAAAKAAAVAAHAALQQAIERIAQVERRATDDEARAVADIDAFVEHFDALEIA
jgi:HK97 family phage portal protein